MANLVILFFAYVESPRSFTRNFFLRDTLHKTRVVGSAGELGTIFKNNLRGIALGVRPNEERTLIPFSLFWKN